MRVAVAFQDERLEFDLPDDRVAGHWHGPAGVPSADVGALVRDALERPRGFPPLRQAVVPGDRVVIPVDPSVPELGPVLAALADALRPAGVEVGDILALASGPSAARMPEALPLGMTWAVHDPDDYAQIAYLATTSGGRRVYLSRHLTDADCVIPVGRLGFDPVLSYRGPWSVIYPGLGDAETRRAFRAMATDTPAGREAGRPAMAESSEVSWLLGCQFHIGIVPGAAGLAEVVAGQEATVRAEGIAAVDASWSVQAEERADLVVAGLGAPGRPTSLDDLAEGLATAASLVRRGGKIVVLSRAEGPIGAALQRLGGADDPRSGLATLRGMEGEPDYPTARQLAHALAWADVYLLSALPEANVDDLSMIPLSRPEEARRLAAASPSCLFLSQADRARAAIANESA